MNSAARPTGIFRSTGSGSADPWYNDDVNDVDQARADRARARRARWSVERRALGSGEPVRVGSADALAGMWQLAVDTWLMSGQPLPSYTREEMPGRVLRPSGVT
jgi:hypothetical protein